MNKTITLAILMYVTSMPVYSMSDVELQMQKKVITPQTNTQNNQIQKNVKDLNQRNFIMVPGHVMQQVPHHENSEIIINTLPNGSYYRHSTRTLPIIIERNYYNTIPEPAVQEPMPLTYDQQQSNLTLITNVLNTQLVTVVDLGFGYLVPGPNNQTFYHSKITRTPPIIIEQFLSSDEYYYLTGDRR